MRHHLLWLYTTIVVIAVHAPALLSVQPARAERAPAVSFQQDIPIVDVLMTDYAFTPMDVVVAPGAVRLRIMNAGLRRHNVVALVGGVEQASPTIAAGDLLEWDLVVETPGRYMLWCNEYGHIEKGMTGTVIVE